MADRPSTHGHDCWGWGPKHYECALREIERLAAQLTAAQQPAAPSEEAGGFDANFLRHIASVCRAAYDLCQPKPQRTPEDPREYHGELCLSELANIADEIERRLAAPSGKAEDGCHCGTCTCNPNMTPAVRFDLSPAQQEGAIREHLIRLGWTPPDQPALSQPAAVDGAKETDLWRCTVCGGVGTVGRCCGEETREPYRPNKGHDAAMANERGGDE